MGKKMKRAREEKRNAEQVNWQKAPDKNQTQQRYVVCPACGGGRKPEYPTCKNCKDKYDYEAADTLVKGGVPISIKEWVLREIKKKISQLPQLEAKEQALTAKLDALKAETEKAAEDAIFQTLKGQKFEKSVVDRAIALKNDQLWIERGGNRLYGERATIRGQITAIREVVARELREKVKPAAAEIPVKPQPQLQPQLQPLPQ